MIKNVNSFNIVISIFATGLGISSLSYAKAEQAISLIKDQIYLTSAQDYELSKNNTIEKIHLLGNKKGYQYLLKIDVSKLSRTNLKEVKGEITCDSSITLDKSVIPSKIVRDSRISFNIYSNYSNDDYATAHPNPKLYFDENVKSCDLYLTFIKGNYETVQNGVRLIKETEKFSFLKDLEQKKDTCRFDHSPSLDLTDKFFLTNNFRNMTCVQRVDQVRFLENSFSGFKAKVKALLGFEVPDSFILNADPMASLDFSKAPHLKAIFLTSLIYRNDFYGTVMNRLLKFHADRGALVYILTTDYMQSARDHEILRNLSRNHGNIKLQEYKYDTSLGKSNVIGDEFNELHRNMHMKLLVTIADKPEENVVITGGRNIHDGFLFKDKPAYEQHPAIADYAKESHVYWSDFEMQMTSPDLARNVFSHLLTFWNRDTKTQMIDFIDTKSMSVSSDLLEMNKSKQLMVRHIVSVPFNDQQSLERLYVDMIDSAQRKIKFSSPYLRPTKNISQALDRATARGVDITIQTRIDLAGDTQAWLYTEMNKASINHFKDNVKVYEWIQPSILHSKFMLIDDELAFVGSVNVSRRSFVHDIESGFLIRSSEFVNNMDKLFQSYNAQSRLVTEHQKSKLIPATIINIIPNMF